MHYRLLRNNKESGPFTALQLKDMGLKPYDLLWTEGRGAAWQYASEITELKDFAPVVEEQAFERLYKRQETLQTAAQLTVAAKKVKPRYRISNGQLIMVEAGTMEVGTNGVIKETAPAAQTAPIAPVLEKKTAEAQDWETVYPQWQPQPKKEVKKEATVEVETKYSESLDDLKKRYAEKVLGDKKESSSPSLSSASVKQNLMAIVALVVLVAGGYIGYTLKKKDAAVTNGYPSVERADIAGGNTGGAQTTESTTSSDEDNTTATGKNNAAQNSSLPASIGSKQTTIVNTTKNNNQSSVAASVFVAKETSNKAAVVPQKQSLETTAKTNAAQANKAAIKPVVPADKTQAKPDNVVSKTTNTSQKNNTASPSSLPVAPIAKSAVKQINDYVSIKKLGGAGAGVQNVKLMVSNVSDFPIDLAVVDIQYFDSKGKYQKGETMYVKDISGGNNVEVRVPDSEKASSIKYKISMVQADQKTLYMVAD